MWSQSIGECSQAICQRAYLGAIFQAAQGADVTPLVSYTVPCHKREADLYAALPSVLIAASLHPPVEIVIVDYGNERSLLSTELMNLVSDVTRGSVISHGLGMVAVAQNIVHVKRVQAEYFHMAHARNVGIREATGDIVVAFLADQIVSPDFFQWIRHQLHPGEFLKWHETFVFNRAEILEAGGFDERFEFYGPEGKELADRLERRGLKTVALRKAVVSQIPTSNVEKVRNYREKLSKREMHLRGMAIWEANREANLLAANHGVEWGAA